MMGTLAAVLAGKKIRTQEGSYRAKVEGDIEKVGDIIKITEIRVMYYLKVAAEKVAEAKEAFSSYLALCPAAQSVIGCIAIRDQLEIEETS
jgi:hypothetical protein